MTSLRMIEDDKKCKTSSSNDYFKYNVGETLKNMRLSKNLTQKFVARANGLSPAMISLIESNNISASITTLTKLLKFYGVSMSWLFNDNNVTSRYEIIRKDDRRVLSKISVLNGSRNGNGFCCESLAQMRRKKMHPYIITLSKDIVGDNVYTHFGESFMYVLKGAIELTLGDRQVVIGEGDSAYLDAALEHGFRSRDGSEVMVLVVKMTES